MKVTADVNEGGVLVVAMDLRGLDFLLIRRLVKALADLASQSYPTPAWSDEAAVGKYLTAMVPSAATVISVGAQLLSGTKPVPPVPGPGPNPNI